MGEASDLGMAILLLISFATFYNFAWLYFRDGLFAHHSLAAPRGDRDDGKLSLAAAGRAFSATFALSACIFELIIVEVAGILDPASSSLAWKACLTMMVAALHLFLPFLLAYACLGEAGLGRRPSLVGAMGAILLLLALVWSQHDDEGVTVEGGGRGGEIHGDGSGAGGDDDSPPRPPSMFSLEAGLARVGVVGVSSLALLSGFGAVNLPYRHIATLFRSVPSSLVWARERRVKLTLAEIGQRKRRAAALRSADWSNGGAGSAGSKKTRGWLVDTVMRVFATGSGDNGASNAALEEAKTANLEQLTQELFLEIADCRRIQEQQKRARTFTGRILVGFGAVMFFYCLLRLWKAAVTVSRSFSYYQGVATAAAAGGPRGGGMDDDPATRLVRFALSRHLLDDVDAADGWSEVISFVLIGVLVLLQTRGFLVTLMTMSRASITSGVSLPAQVQSLLLSMLMGAYFTSSVIMLRVNLPPRHRVAITAVLGGMRFSFYKMWFDTFFLLSGCATAVTLVAFHLANRSSDADKAEVASAGGGFQRKPHEALD